METGRVITLLILLSILILGSVTSCTEFPMRGAEIRVSKITEVTLRPLQEVFDCEDVLVMKLSDQGIKDYLKLTRFVNDVVSEGSGYISTVAPVAYEVYVDTTDYIMYIPFKLTEEGFHGPHIKE